MFCLGSLSFSLCNVESSGLADMWVFCNRFAFFVSDMLFFFSFASELFYLSCYPLPVSNTPPPKNTELQKSGKTITKTRSMSQPEKLQMHSLLQQRLKLKHTASALFAIPFYDLI